MASFLITLFVVGGAVISVTYGVRLLRKARRGDPRTGLRTLVTDPLRAFAQAHCMDTAVSALTLLTSLATVVAAAVATHSQRTKATMTTLTFAVANLLLHVTHFLSLSQCDLTHVAAAVVRGEFDPAGRRQPLPSRVWDPYGDRDTVEVITESATGVAEAVGRLCAVLAVAVSASYGSRRTLAEIISSAPIHIGRAHQSTQSLWKVIKDIWTSVHPDLSEQRNLDEMKTKLDTLQSLGSTPNREFIRRDVQARIKATNRGLDELARTLPRSDPGDHMKRRLLAEQGRIAVRINELRPVIDLSSNVRRLPVFINLRGKPGRGKSHLLGRLHRDMSQWMIDNGHLDRPMDRLIGTGGGDDYLPPIGNQEWYVVDEYLGSLDDPWVGVMNKMVSDNPVTLSGAFVKNVEPHPHFVVTTSNISVPFSFPASSKNYMRREVLNAFHSRHQWVMFDKPDYNERLGRNDPANHALPFTLTWERMTIHDEGSPDVDQEVITYDQLLQRMQEQWMRNNNKYLDEMAKIAVPEENVRPEAGLTNPRVISFLGATGQGKTWAIQNLVIPILAATMNIVEPKTGERPVKVLEPSVYVVDDILTTQEGGWSWYRSFYDSLSGDDVIVVADNFQIQWKPKEWWLWDVLEYLNGVYRGIHVFSWKKLWEPGIRVPHPDGLPHEALIRRLGITSQCVYRGRLVAPATGSPDLCALVDLNGMRLSSDFWRVLQHEDILDHVATVSRGANRELRRVPKIQTPAEWDLDIRVAAPADVLRYLTRPTDQYYVRVNPTLALAFPDYRAILGHLTEELEPNLILDALARAYRRRAFTARVQCGHRYFAVAGGEVEGLGLSDETDLSLEPSDAGVLLRFRHYTNLIQWEDFLRKTADLRALTPRELIRYTVERNVLLATPIAQTRLLESQIEARRVELQARAARAWQTVYTQMQKNKNLMFVIAALTAAVAGGGAIWLYLSYQREMGDPESLEDPAEKLPKKVQRTVAVKAARNNPESLEERSERPPQKVVRAVAAKTAHNAPESYEEKANRAPVVTTRKLAVVQHVRKSPEAIDVDGKPSALHPMISVIREKIDNNLVWLSNGRVQCYGIGYRDHLIVCPAHILNGGGATAASMLVKTETVSFPTQVQNVIPSRDIAILEKVGGPSFKDIRKHFPLASELPLHTAALQYIPKNDIMISKDLTFSQRMGFRLTNAEWPEWRPDTMIYYAEHWSTPKLTARGDCGTPYISLNSKQDARRICGIHIAAGSEHSSYAASVAQEDLELISIEATAGPQAVRILEKEWVLPDNIKSFEKDGTVGGYTGLEDTDRLQFVGFYPDLFSPSWNRGGDLKRSRISHRLNTEILENDQLPAPVSYRDPHIDPAERNLLPRGRDGHPSLGAKQLGFISGQHSRLSSEIKERVIKAITAMWLLVPGMTDWRPLSLDEALNGVDEPKWAGVVGAIRGDTSPGLPWKKFGLHKKSDLLERTSSDGERLRWAFAPSKHGQRLATVVGETLTTWASGQQYLRFVDCNLKVECLPARKVAAANSRMFLAESMDAFLAQRVVCGFLQAIAMKTRWTTHQHHTTGINPYTEFQVMYAKLTEVSDFGFDADYSKFDKKIPIWAWEILEEVMVRVAGKSRYGRVPHYENQIRQFVISLRDKLYVFEGNLFFAQGDQASGVFPTNIGDSWLNDIIVVTVLTLIAESNHTHPVWKKIAPGRTLDMQQLAHYVRWFTHGDDVVVSVHEALHENTHFAAFRDVLKDYGMILTLPSKTSDDAFLVPLKDISFIGRTFEFDREGSQRPHGKLRKTAIARMLHWTRDGSWVALRENLEAAARELRAYPRGDYERITAEVERVTADAGRPFIFPAWEDARLDLIEERDEITSEPACLSLDSRSYAECPKDFVCSPEAKEACEPPEPIRIADSGLGARSDLPVAGEGRGAPRGHCQAVAPAGNEYQRSTKRRIPEPRAKTYQWVEIDSPRALDLSMAAVSLAGRKSEPNQFMDSSPTNKNNNNIKTTHQASYPTKLEEQEQWRRQYYLGSDDFLACNGLESLYAAFDMGEEPWVFTDPKVPIPTSIAIPATPKTGAVHVSPAKAWSALNYREMPWLPRAVYIPLQCAACTAVPSGIVKFAEHARNSHPHLISINCWPISPVVVQCGDQHIKMSGPVATRVSAAQSLAREAQPESAVQAADSLAAAQPGVDPAAGAMLNAAEQSNALASTGGIEVGIASSAIGSGVVAPVEEAITLVGPTLPPTIGAITGVQWSSYEVDRTAYEIISDVNISASETPTGVLVARVAWGTFGPNMAARLAENRYMSGCTEVQAQFYGTTNTAGSLIVYLAEDVSAPMSSVSNILRRPHWLISAAAGTTTQAFLVHQTQETVLARRTDFSDGELRPELRIAMYSPLVNTYGTDVQLNMKLLTRPGPDFRMWSPIPIEMRDVRITRQALPAARYIVVDRLRGQGWLHPPAPQTESPIGRKAYIRRSAELPNSEIESGLVDVDPRMQYTGILNPLMVSGGGPGPEDFTIFTGNLSSESSYQTSLPPDVFDRVLLQTIGRAANYGYVGSFSLSTVIGGLQSGFAGTVDSSDIGDVTSSLCFENVDAKSSFGYETFTFGNFATRDEKVREAIWEDRARTATTGFNAAFHSAWTAGMGVLVFKDRSPALVANDLTAFNINAWDESNNNFYDILKKLYAEWGQSSWVLEVGGVTLGRVGLAQSGDSYALAIDTTYALRPTDGEQVILHSPQIWEPSTHLEVNTTEWSSLLVPVTREIKEHRETLLRNKPKWKRVTLGRLDAKSTMEAYIEAALVGGIFSGIGGGLSQGAQNRWWSKEFEKQREAELEKMQHKATYVSKGMEQKAEIAAEAREVEMINDQELQSLRTQQSAARVGITEPPPPHSKVDPNPASSRAGPSPGTPAPGGPAKPPVGNPVTPTQPFGSNTTKPEQYHPANELQSPGSLVDPTAVSNAVNPYTESMKRV